VLFIIVSGVCLQWWLKGGCIWYFSLVFRLYTEPLSCSFSSTDLCSSCAEIWFLLIIYLLFKKKNAEEPILKGGCTCVK
jgi:hypothetical protein